LGLAPIQPGKPAAHRRTEVSQRHPLE
jgi:hypothetical protein